MGRAASITVIPFPALTIRIMAQRGTLLSRAPLNVANDRSWDYYWQSQVSSFDAEQKKRPLFPLAQVQASPGCEPAPDTTGTEEHPPHAFV
jgi:hypothetical protein